jgi:hypothetical protein
VVARGLCRKLIAATANHDISAYDYGDLIKGLLQVHPAAMLDELLSDNAESCRQGVRLLRSVSRYDRAALDVLPEEILLAWCDLDPARRYPIAASVVPLFKQPREGESEEWTPLVIRLLGHAPDAPLVLNEIVHRLSPSSWSGSRASILETRLRLLDSLPIDGAPVLAAALAKARIDLEAQVAAERRYEMEEERSRSNRFE